MSGAFPRSDGVIPVAVEVVPLEIDGEHFLFGDLDTLGVFAFVDFRSDAYGRRVEKHVPATGDTAHFYYDGWRVVEEYTDDGQATTLSARNVWGLYLDELVVRTSVGDSEDYYPIHNPTYSALRVYDDEGNLEARVKYTPYGKATLLDSQGQAADIDLPQLFTGQAYDVETALYFYKSRYLSPSSGRFIRRDPLSWEFLAEHAYQYVLSSPAVLVDPEGLLDEEVPTFERSDDQYQDPRFDTPHLVPVAYFSRKPGQVKGCCVPTAINLTPMGSKASTSLLFWHKGLGRHKSPWHHGWYEGGERENKVGHVLSSAKHLFGARTCFNWEAVITFKGDPMACTWGREIKRLKTVRWKYGRKVESSGQWSFHKDPYLDNSYVLGSKVYMYDSPDITENDQAFRIWARSSDGKRKISRTFTVGAKGLSVGPTIGLPPIPKPGSGRASNSRLGRALDILRRLRNTFDPRSLPVPIMK